MGIFGKFGSTKNDVKVAKYEYKKAKLESKEKEKQAKLEEKTSKTQQLASNANSALEYTELNFEKISQKLAICVMIPQTLSLAKKTCQGENFQEMKNASYQMLKTKFIIIFDISI